jgi:hypothetical protein
MMQRQSLAALLSLACLLTGCAGQDSSPEIQQETVLQASNLAAGFKATLMATLMEGLADGPKQAIGACAVRAPELAAEYSRDGIRIGRTALRLRNPANAPEPWLEPLLEEYLAAGPGAGPQAVRIDASTVGYVEPLYVGRPCLTCHGEIIAEEVRDQIEAAYPEDDSVGFREGDFRGLLWVTINEDGV